MNLIIDIGNSQVKSAIFNNRKILKNIISDEFNPEMLYELKAQYPELTQAILCSVADCDEKLLGILKKEFDLFIELNHLTTIPIENLYESKESLGQEVNPADVDPRRRGPDPQGSPAGHRELA